MCSIISSFVGEEVDRSDLAAVQEELLATSASYEPEGKHLPGQHDNPNDHDTEEP
jgi:hypothetical protein